MTNPNCGMCGNLNVRGFCNLTACSFPSNKTGTIRVKKQTNADRIRNMTDDELAKFISGKARGFGEEYEGYMSALDWLKEESDGE